MKNKDKPIRPIFNWIWLFIISLGLSGLSLALAGSAYDFSRIRGVGVYSITTYDYAILIPLMILAVIVGVAALFAFLHTIKSFKMETIVRSMEVFHGKQREITRGAK